MQLVLNKSGYHLQVEGDQSLRHGHKVRLCCIMEAAEVHLTCGLADTFQGTYWKQ